MAGKSRSDQISKYLGDYMLKGYCLLGSTCDDCGVCLFPSNFDIQTILLRDRQQNLLCVACTHVDVKKTDAEPQADPQPELKLEPSKKLDTPPEKQPKLDTHAQHLSVSKTRVEEIISAIAASTEVNFVRHL